MTRTAKANSPATPACSPRAEPLPPKAATSWTVDFAGRRKMAREERKPLVAEAEAAKAETVSLKEKLKALKAINPKDKKIESLESKIAEREKAARDSQSKADAIDAAVFDLKAVNPNAIVKIDTLSPDEVIRSIEEQGKTWRSRSPP
jgi:type I restriction enzyme M protein